MLPVNSFWLNSRSPSWSNGQENQEVDRRSDYWRDQKPGEVEINISDQTKSKEKENKFCLNTRYGAYLIVKVSKHAYGLDLVPAEVCMKSSNGRTVKNKVYLCCLDEKKQQMKRLLYGNREERMAMTVGMVGADHEKRREPKGRDDGWMEIELGEFETREGEDDEVNMSLTEVKGYQLKGGIVIDGIEVRPKSLN
uniref:F-box domain-containing protein n=1 Tax=Brassica oleracea var. oleracea TaxID=109376 RepID=A0A0D2ZQ00_BRAOL